MVVVSFLKLPLLMSFVFFLNLEKLRDEIGHLLTVYCTSDVLTEFYPMQVTPYQG